MKSHSITIAAAAFGGLAALTATTTLPIAAAYAAPANEQTNMFAIKNMTCATCPITVKTAMSRVAGVKSVTVDFKAKTATVTYDPALTTPTRIAAASTGAGYPAQLRGS